MQEKQLTARKQPVVVIAQGILILNRDEMEF